MLIDFEKFYAEVSKRAKTAVADARKAHNSGDNLEAQMRLATANALVEVRDALEAAVVK